MKTFNQQAAQGDCLITKVDALEGDHWEQVEPENNQHIIAHSETGHHHTVPAQGVIVFRHKNNAFVLGLKVTKPTQLTHQRNYDTHEAIELPVGEYEIRRQREYHMQSFRRVAD